MIDLIFDQKERVGEWIAKEVEQTASWGDFYAMGVEWDGELAAGILFNGFNGSNATCHFAVRRSGKHFIDLLIHSYRYAFEQCKLNRLTCMVEDSNKASLRLTERIGFQPEFVMPKGGSDGQDLHIRVLWPDNFRYRSRL